MKLGLQLNSFDWVGGPARFGERLGRIARAAEEAGLDRLGVADHLWLHPIMGGPEGSEPECYTTLGFLAAGTRHTSLMAMVSGVHFRHPAVLVKAVTTLDVLSGGPGSASGRATTRKRRGASASRSPRKESATGCSRRPSRWPCGCGAAVRATSVHSRASTTGWRGP